MASYISSIELKTYLEEVGLKSKIIMGSRGFISAQRKTRIRYRDEYGILRLIEDDLSSKNISVNVEALFQEMEDSSINILMPIPSDVDKTGGILVCDADLVAAEVASSLKAERFFVISEVPAFLDCGVPRLSVQLNEIQALIPKTTGGMKKKLFFIQSYLQKTGKRVDFGNADILISSEVGTRFVV